MRRITVAVAVCCLLCGFAVQPGCTVIPQTVSDNAPSFDGGVQNSGFIGYDAVGNGILTPNARTRYNLLIEQFGKRYLPPLKIDDGIIPTTTNTFLIAPQYLVDFREMNRWRKAKTP